MEIFNPIELHIKAFFFNAETDYLPYYKNFSFEIKGEETLLDILKRIKEKNSDFSYPNKRVVLRVNNLLLSADEKISVVIERVGKTFRIDPALIYRSNNGLILNDDDFMESFKLLADYADTEDRDYYESLYPLHYASASFEYNHNYIGDAILLLASRLIEKNPDKEDDILEAINDEFNGIIACEYENNLFHPEEHTQTIENLKKTILKKRKLSVIDRLTNLAVKQKTYRLNRDNLSEHQIALYGGSEEDKAYLLNNNDATFIDFPMSNRLAGQTIVDTNPELAHQKAGKMLLEALDHGADTLLFANDEDLALFRNMLPKCERVMGRDITLNLIAFNELQRFKSKATL